ICSGMASAVITPHTCMYTPIAIAAASTLVDVDRHSTPMRSATVSQLLYDCIPQERQKENKKEKEGWKGREWKGNGVGKVWEYLVVQSCARSTEMNIS